MIIHTTFRLAHFSGQLLLDPPSKFVIHPTVLLDSFNRLSFLLNVLLKKILKAGRVILEKDGRLSLIPRSSETNTFVWCSDCSLQNCPPHLLNVIFKGYDKVCGNPHVSIILFLYLSPVLPIHCDSQKKKSQTYSFLKSLWSVITDVSTQI